MRNNRINIDDLVCGCFYARQDDDTSATGAVGRSCVPNIPGAEDMMSEMTRRLRERRAKAENNTHVSETLSSL